jgi:hypothetical protein
MKQDFFKIGDFITEKVITSLKNKLNLVGVVVGGGYGYDSIKYKDTEKMGDLDYLAVVEDISDFANFAQDKSLIEECGFEISETNTYYEKDLRLFESEAVSILRFSGINNGLKSTLNFTTIERLQSMYNKDSQEKAYKIAHGKSQNILVAKGTDGTDLILALIAPEVSAWFGDDIKHFLIPDHTWYEENGYLHAGILTDFIAKGKVSNCKDKLLTELQESILKFMKQCSSTQIRESHQWHLMFASNNYFSENFKKLINKKVDNLEVDFKEASPTLSPQKHLGVVFARAEYYAAKLLTEDSIKFKVKDRTGVPFQELVESKLTYDDILHIINAEAKRLSILLSLSQNNKEFNLPKDCRYDNLIFLPKDELVSSTDEQAFCSIYDYIIQTCASDHSKLKHNNKADRELLNFLTQLRFIVAGRILGRTEGTLIYASKYEIH